MIFRNIPSENVEFVLDFTVADAHRTKASGNEGKFKSTVDNCTVKMLFFTGSFPDPCPGRSSWS